MFYYCYKIILTAGTLRGKYYIGKRIYRGKDINKDPYKGSLLIITKDSLMHTKRLFWQLALMQMNYLN